MVINKKIKRAMFESKAQYIGSLLLIIISSLLFTMLNQVAVNMKDILNDFQKNYVQEDANFIADKKITDTSMLESKFNMLIEENRVADYQVEEGKVIRVFSQNTKINLPAVIKGSNLTGNDILLDPEFAKANNIKLGDSYKVFDKMFRVSGFMSLPNYIYPIKNEGDLVNNPKSFGIAVIGKDDFKNLNKGNFVYSIKFRNEANLQNQISQFKNYLKDEKVVIIKWSNINENPRVIYVSAKVQSIDSISATLPTAIFLLTCILTGIVMWRMLKRESIIIGTLYALGYKKREIMLHYLSYPMIIAVLGGLLGTILGAVTIKPMIDFMIQYFNMPVNSISFNPVYAVLSVVLPVFFLGASGLFVVNKALKSSPVELMKGGKDSGKVGIIERNLKLERLNFNTKFKVREQLRSIPRISFLLLGVILATVLLLYGFCTKSSMDKLMKDAYEKTFMYKYEYLMNSLQKDIPNGAEAFTVSPFTVKSDDKMVFNIYGVNPATKYLNLEDKSGKRLDSKGVIITRPLADKLNIAANDVITVINKLDSREYKITVDSIAETYVGQNIYMPLDKLNELLKYPKGSYIGLWSNEKINISENLILSASTIDDLKKSFDTMTKPLQSMIGVLSFMSFLIGLIIIFVVTSLIIEENKENISLMKVFGYKRKELNSLILNSSTIIVIIGYIVGIPVMFGSLKALFNSITKDLNFAFPISISYAYLIAGFVVIYLAYEISKSVSRRKISKISMSEALKASME
ncbi:MAG: ABC transporter permease [Bacillota bacterium]|nr:ABC transporter permease [Bacillota bacterium]